MLSTVSSTARRQGSQRLSAAVRFASSSSSSTTEQAAQKAQQAANQAGAKAQQALSGVQKTVGNLLGGESSLAWPCDRIDAGRAARENCPHSIGKTTTKDSPSISSCLATVGIRSGVG